MTTAVISPGVIYHEFGTFEGPNTAIGATTWQVNPSLDNNDGFGNSTMRWANLNVVATGVQFFANATVSGSAVSGGVGNGYTVLPGGIILNWGTVTSNTSVGAVTFAQPYAINAYSITATSNTATDLCWVTAYTKTGATILNTNVVDVPVMFIAIGQ